MLEPRPSVTIASELLDKGRTTVASVGGITEGEASAPRKDRLVQLVFVPIGLYVAVMLGIAALVVHPPLLGWIGLAVSSVIALSAGALALAFFTRMRTNADRLHPRPAALYRLLVVTDVDVEPAQLRSSVRLRTTGRRAEVRVVAPVVTSPLHFFSADEEHEDAAARRRLRATLAALAKAGIPARGGLGTDDPLQAVGDALRGFPADEILLVTRLESTRSWVDRKFERRARDLFGVPVSTVFGPSSNS
jgi:hypothetical protein